MILSDSTRDSVRARQGGHRIVRLPGGTTLALGVAGVSASQTVSLEVRMARNGHDGELALQAAESALREGERIVASGGFDPAAPGFYAGAVFGAPEPWDAPGNLARREQSRGNAPGWCRPAAPIHRRTDRIVGGPRRRRGGIQSDRARHRRHAARARRAAERVRVVITRWRHGFRAETVHSAVVARTGGPLICG